MFAIYTHSLNLVVSSYESTHRCNYANYPFVNDRCHLEHSKTSFEKNCFSAWASMPNMGLINKVDMVCLSPVGYGV